MHKFKLVLFSLFISSIAFGQSMTASQFEQDYQKVLSALKSASSQDQRVAVLRDYYGLLIDQLGAMEDDTSDLYWRIVSMSTRVSSIRHESCNTLVGSMKYKDPDDRAGEIKDRDKGVVLAQVFCKRR